MSIDVCFKLFGLLQGDEGDARQGAKSELMRRGPSQWRDARQGDKSETRPCPQNATTNKSNGWMKWMDGWMDDLMFER